MVIIIIKEALFHIYIYIYIYNKTLIYVMIALGSVHMVDPDPPSQLLHVLCR